MKRFHIIVAVALLFSSCEEKKIEFVQSNVYPSLFLLNNVPENDSLVKKEIKLFLLKYSPGKEKYSTRFYKKILIPNILLIIGKIRVVFQVKKFLCMIMKQN